MSTLFSVATLFATAALTSAATYEPPGNQVLLGMWADSQGHIGDTPAKLNQLTGHNFPVFQMSQVIPMVPYNWTTGRLEQVAPLQNGYLVELSDTDAAFYLTVYPMKGFASVTTADFTTLGQQIAAYQAPPNNRTVYLRYAPEMQGIWFPYGNQPDSFKTSWRAMHAAVSAVAPGTQFIWGPNTPQNYPYGNPLTGTMGAGTNTPADQAALDTNGDGRLTEADDAFSPYYPGDDFVDWIGLSLYYKGMEAYQDAQNNAQMPGFCGQAINGIDPGSGKTISNWYANYCAAKPSKPCMLSESGAAWHPQRITAPGSTSNQVQLMSAWINDCITNATFLDTFPRLKMIMQFNFEKEETSNQLGQQQPGDAQDLRDYCITNNSDVLAVLQAGLNQPQLATRFSWANFRPRPTSISSPGAAAPATDARGSTITQAAIITGTARARSTDFPALFGQRPKEETTGAAVAELVILAMAGLIAMFALLRFV